MPAPAATVGETKIMDLFAVLLADCVAFQAFVEQTTAAAAYGRIYQAEQANVADSFAMIGDPEKWGIPISVRFPHGDLWVLFERVLKPAETADPLTALRVFGNFAGEIMLEAFDKSEASETKGYLLIRDYRAAFGPARTAEAERINRDVFQVAYLIEFGLDDGVRHMRG